MVLLIATSTSVIEAVPACDYEEEAWLLCQTDAMCRTRFYIFTGDQHDRDRFNYLFARYLVELGLEGDEAVLDTTCPLPDPNPLWLPLLRQARFCTDNEVVELGVGCVCRHDKICHETPSKDILFDTLSYSVWVVLFTLVVLYYGWFHSHELRRMLRERVDRGHRDFDLLPHLGGEVKTVAGKTGFKFAVPKTGTNKRQ